MRKWCQVADLFRGAAREAGGEVALLQPKCLDRSGGLTYLANRTTIAPMRSPFLKSFFGLIGWALWQDTHDSAMAKSAAMPLNWFPSSNVIIPVAGFAASFLRASSSAWVLGTFSF